MGNDANGRYISDASINLQSGIDLHPGGRFTATTKALLQAVNADLRFDGMEILVTADNSRWIFSAASALADTTSNLVITPTNGTGAWLRVDRHVALKLAIAFGNADADVLFAMPASGFRLMLQSVFWEVTTSFAGGSSSAIGISSATAPHDTKGDLLGGSGGDVAAMLVSTTAMTQGTIGVSYSSAPKMAVLEPAATLRFDRITSAFTSGAGFVHAVGRLIA